MVMVDKRKILFIVISVFIASSLISYYYKFINPVVTIDYNSLSLVDKLVNLLPLPNIVLLSTYDPSISVKVSIDNLKRDFPDLYSYFKYLDSRYTTHIEFRDMSLLLKTSKENYNNYPSKIYYNKIGVSSPKYYDFLCKKRYDNSFVIYKGCNRPFALSFQYGRWPYSQKIIIRAGVFKPLPSKVCVEGYWWVGTPSGSHQKKSNYIRYCSPDISVHISNWEIEIGNGKLKG